MATIYCMNCGTPLDEDARFCDACGSPTLLGAGLRDPGTKAPATCPMCGAIVEVYADHCPTCGASFDQTAPIVGTASVAMPVHVRNEEKTAPSRPVVIAAAAGALCVALGLGTLVYRATTSGNADQTAPEPAQEEPAAEEEETSLLTSAGIEPRATLADYSWQELSIIGKEMTRRGSREAALEIAREYHLVDESGALTDVTREVTIEGMGVVPVRLADIYHDTLASGEGTAGLTFMASDLTLAHVMKQTDDNAGGWEGSDLRAWLNNDVYNALGEDLAPYLETADVHTNNVGQTTNIGAVTSTLDRLWVPSVVEVCGPVEWQWDSDLENSDQYNAVLNAEGSQYACFSGVVSSSTEPNEALALTGASGATQWWLRSSSASKTEHYRLVKWDGNPSQWGSAPQWLGVRFCFCL